MSTIDRAVNTGIEFMREKKRFTKPRNSSVDKSFTVEGDPKSWESLKFEAHVKHKLIAHKIFNEKKFVFFISLLIIISILHYFMP